MDINKLIIRPEKQLDYRAIAKVHNLAFKQEDEAKLVERIRASNLYIPQLSLVAEIDNKIIGHIMFSYIDLVDDQESIKVLALAPISVLPEYQNRGVGSELIKKGVEIAANLSAPLIIVLGYFEFYSRFGFVPSVNYGIEIPFPVPKEAFMVKLLHDCQKWDKAKVIYPSAFRE